MEGTVALPLNIVLDLKKEEFEIHPRIYKIENGSLPSGPYASKILNMYNVILHLAILGATTQASALPYFLHSRNEDLKAQVESDPQRILPKFDKVSLAADTYLYKPWGVEEYYYHGNGYWVNLLAEARPHSDITANLKIAAYNGASSYGYSRSDYIQPFFGLTWTPRFVSDNFHFYFRYFDLDRQTLAAGLMLEDKEMNGMILSAEFSGLRYKGVIDGTGGFYPQGDLYYQQIDWRADLIGASLLFINYQGNLYNARSEVTQSVSSFSPLLYSIFSIAAIGKSWTLKNEIGLRANAIGALTSIKYQPETSGRWRGFVQAQGRRYAAGFADEIEGFVQQDYVSPEVEDKSFIETRNIFARGDDVTVAATRFDIEYRPVPTFLIVTSNELYNMDYRNKQISGWFFNQSIGMCPYTDRPNDCLVFFVSNKIPNTRSPRGGDLPEYSLAKQISFGAHAFVYF